ncbi:MAG: hypothetical protein QM500_17775 [Methylococcales bacterium]
MTRFMIPDRIKCDDILKTLVTDNFENIKHLNAHYISSGGTDSGFSATIAANNGDLIISRASTDNIYYVEGRDEDSGFYGLKSFDLKNIESGDIDKIANSIIDSAKIIAQGDKLKMNFKEYDEYKKSIFNKSDDIKVDLDQYQKHTKAIGDDLSKPGEAVKLC